MAKPIDKGRIVAEVDEYPDRDTDGKQKFNVDGSPKMKKKFWPIGECLKWQGDNGEFVTRTIFCQPCGSGKFEQREYWDSESDKPEQQAPYQAAAPVNVGYQFADGTPIAPSDVQRYIRAGVAKWPMGQNPPPIPAGY